MLLSCPADTPCINAQTSHFSLPELTEFLHYRYCSNTHIAYTNPITIIHKCTGIPMLNPDPWEWFLW